jgi:hypothetical protein
MNIFKILSSGDGSIKEPSISAFLGYLLDPRQEHGLKDGLLKALIGPLVLESEIKELIINRQDLDVVDLTNESKFTVDIELEKKVPTEIGSLRFIDIVVKIFDTNNKLIFIVCIENKIRSGSVTPGQLDEQLKGIKKVYPKTKIGYIYLTPNSSERSKAEYKDFKESNEDIPAKHVFWKGHHESIYELLVDMLSQESKGSIEPIFEYSKYTIKSFLNFINTNFQSYVEEKSSINTRLDYGKPFREYIKDVYDGLEYNQQITVEHLKSEITSVVYKATGLDINRGTLNAQVYANIVNENNRVHYNVNKKNHHKYDLFYYVDESKKIVQKFSKEKSPKDIQIIYKD